MSWLHECLYCGARRSQPHSEGCPDFIGPEPPRRGPLLGEDGKVTWRLQWRYRHLEGTLYDPQSREV